MIPANDFHRQWLDIGTDAVAAFERTGESGWYILGQEVRDFEAALGAYWNLPHCVGVASGLDAIEICLRALGCKPGSKVLTTPVSAFATTLAIVKLGGVPVFADTDKYGLLDLASARRALLHDPSIRYLAPVHLFGHALNLADLTTLAAEFSVAVVEDCAQSIGASWQGRPTGSVGQMAATSFYPTKNLGAMGDGGAILTRSDRLAEHARALRDYGQTSKYRHELVGYNSRLDELQASLLHRVSLPRLNGWTARRRAIARCYLDGIRHRDVRVPGAPRGSDSCWHLFPVLVPPTCKTGFLSHLKSCGVAAGEHYPVAIPDQPALTTVRYEVSGDGVERARHFCRSEASLPIHPYLTDAEITTVIDSVNSWRP